MILTVLGARPQFVKAAVVSRAFQKVGITEQLIHTGQHYDATLNEVFFETLNIPKPTHNLQVGSGSQTFQTATMMLRLEEIIVSLPQKPEIILVYGDTNSTLAGALVASKLQIPLAHVEAGLRSFNRTMPEEINRIVTDQLATWCFCPTQTALENLQNEHIQTGTLVGDVMLEATQLFTNVTPQTDAFLATLPPSFYLATIHRPENTDSKENLSNILKAFAQLSLPVLLPLHPRTKKMLTHFQLSTPKNVTLLPPVGYLEMLALIRKSEKVLTDSGGLQKEAYWLEKPCITLRNETEWVETLFGNWNQLTGALPEKILHAITINPTTPPAPFGFVPPQLPSERIATFLQG